MPAQAIKAASAECTSAPRLISIKAVLQKVGLSRSTVYDLMRDPDAKFPAPVKIGRASRWLEADVDAFILAAASAGHLESKSV